MKTYRDTSALVETWNNVDLRRRLRAQRGLTRTHSLAEAFSAFTSGNLSVRMDADAAAETIEQLSQDLDFVDLLPKDVIDALKQAKTKGVRGGRVHDFLHAVAAEKCGAKRLLTLDRNDFADLTKVEVEQA